MCYILRDFFLFHVFNKILKTLLSLSITLQMLMYYKYFRLYKAKISGFSFVLELVLSCIVRR